MKHLNKIVLALSFFMLIFISINITLINMNFTELNDTLVKSNNLMEQTINQNKELILIEKEKNYNKLSKETEENIKNILNSAEKTYQVYSKNYIQMLIDSKAKTEEILFPEDSLDKIVEEKRKAFLMNEDLKNHNKSLNNNVVNEKNETKILIERLKKIYPEKNELEIIEMIAQ